MVSEVELYCIAVVDGRRSCITEQGTKYAIEANMCRTIAHGGAYNPTRKPAQQQSDNRQAQRFIREVPQSSQTRFCYPVPIGEGVAMRQVDVVLSVLTLVAVGLGVAAYRAWFPHPVPEVVEPAAVPSSLGPSAAERAQARHQTQLQHDQAALAESIRVRTGVECRNGVLVEHTSDGREVTRYLNGRQARCEIQAEPVSPQDSEASVQTP